LSWVRVDSARVDCASQSDGSRETGADVNWYDESQLKTVVVGVWTLMPSAVKATLRAVEDRVSSNVSGRSRRR